MFPGVTLRSQTKPAKTKQRVFIIEAEVPAGTTAEVVLERNSKKSQTIRLNQKAVKIENENTVKADSKQIRLRVGAGKTIVKFRD